MKYGYFDDEHREYVIQQPETPYPWINYLGTESYFCLISNTAGGYSFYKDASKRRITRYRYNNVPTDSGGKYFYIYEDGDYWSPSWAPVKKELDNYQCRHGLGYTKITGEKRQLKCQLTYFVPTGDSCELHRLRLKNKGDRERTFKVFSLVEFCLWDAVDDQTNFQRNLNTGEVEIEGSVIYHKTEYRERRDHFAFYAVNREIDGYDADREAFKGLYRGFDSPEAVEAGYSRNSRASGWSPIASHSLELTLGPGEETTLIFQLGYVDNSSRDKWKQPGVINKEQAYKLQEKYKTLSAVNRAFARLRDYWEDLLSSFTLKIQKPRLERMINTWNPYQCMVTYNLARSASYFESGINRGIGFRDSNQDLLGVVQMIPEQAKQRLFDLAATQFEDGSTYHQYQPLTKKGNNKIGSGFNDDPLWLIFSTVAYIKETGDYSILEEPVPFNSGQEALLFDHLQSSFEFITDNLGPHNLPLIGHADWNDCLNLNCFSRKPGQSFQTVSNKQDSRAESVLIAGMFITIGPEFQKLCQKLDKNRLAEEVGQQVTAMKRAINRHARGEDWFIRAYDYYGNRVGSRDNQEGKIFIEPQGFCIMGGLGLDDGFARKALVAVNNHLNTDYGLKLIQPAYKKYRIELGEISSYPPGYKENGGIFCHNNPWIMIAETILGNGDRAFEYYKKIAPAYLEEISRLHRTEPYVYAQMIAGDESPNYGEAKNSWLTGTAAWNYIAMTQWILGIRPEFSGLYIDPCIPESWPGFQVKRRFRKADYQISVSNPRGVNKGVKKITVNGQEIEGQLIKPRPAGSVNQIKVIMD